MRQLVEEILQHDRFLQSFQIDNAEYPLHELESAEVSDGTVITIRSCTFDELIEESMASWHKLVPWLHTVATEAVQLIHDGTYAEAIQKTYQLVETTGTTLGLLEQFAKRAPEPGTLVEKIQQEGTAVLGDIVEQAEEGDYVALADAVNYAYLPWLQSFSGMIELFLQQMKLEHSKEQLGRARSTGH